MSAAKQGFSGPIPENYDKFLGPLFFHHYADDMARRVAKVLSLSRVLEIACGTGIVTAALRQQLPDHAEIVATDLAQPMLDYAMAKHGHLKNVTFSQADAQDLPFADGEFDALAFQFGIMFLPDKPKGMAEAARVLTPNGEVHMSVWDSWETNQFVAVAQETIEAFFPSDPPKFLRIPWSFHDHGEINELVASAGFENIQIDAVASTMELPTAYDVACGLVTGNPNILEIQDRLSEGPAEVIDAVASALRTNYGDEPIKVDMQAIMITGQKS